MIATGPFTILIHHSLAERCYLPEALLWLSVCRFPLAEVWENGIDVREDLKLIEGFEPTDSYLDTISDDECARVGLPPNPTYEEMVSGDVHLNPDTLRGMLENNLATDRAKLENDLKESIAFHERRDAWERECDSFFDVYKAKLFVALREGELTAFGKGLPRPSYSDSVEHIDSQFEDEDYVAWYSESWTAIPSSFWVSTGIDWKNSHAEGKGMAQCLVLLQTLELVRCFPPPPPTPAPDVLRIGGTLIQSHQFVTDPVKRPMKGRPALNWDQFHVELARRFKGGDVPGKQEAFIAEMQQWCNQNWGREVARSTLLQKVKPYYDALIRKS